MSGRYYRTDAMYFLLSLHAFLSVYNNINTIIICEHLNERITIYRLTKSNKAHQIKKETYFTPKLGTLSCCMHMQFIICLLRNNTIWTPAGIFFWMNGENVVCPWTKTEVEDLYRGECVEGRVRGQTLVQ